MPHANSTKKYLIVYEKIHSSFPKNKLLVKNVFGPFHFKDFNIIASLNDKPYSKILVSQSIH